MWWISGFTPIVNKTKHFSLWLCLNLRNIWFIEGSTEKGVWLRKHIKQFLNIKLLNINKSRRKKNKNIKTLNSFSAFHRKSYLFCFVFSFRSCLVNLNEMYALFSVKIRKCHKVSLDDLTSFQHGHGTVALSFVYWKCNCPSCWEIPTLYKRWFICRFQVIHRTE